MGSSTPGPVVTDRGVRRLVLVVASQCENATTLDFVPPLDWKAGKVLTSGQRLVFELYEQFLDPAAGACDPVPDLDRIDGACLGTPGGSLLINPTLTVASQALTHSFGKARDLQQVLVVHFVGHGFRHEPGPNSSSGHYLLVADSEAMPATSKQAWNVYADAGDELHAGAPLGFVLLVDACQASSARPKVSGWSNDVSNHVWIGASQHTNAFDGCFTRTLLTTMQTGSRTGRHRPLPELRSRNVRDLVNQSCYRPADKKAQQADSIASIDDDYVYITRNRALAVYESDLGLQDSTADRLRSAIGDHYQTIDVEPLEHALGVDPFVVLTGRAGSGKTALTAVLRDPPDGLDVRRLDAIAFLDASSNIDNIARALHPQLRTNRLYDDLYHRYENTTENIAIKSVHERYLTGPLAGIREGDRILIGLDGLDQLDPAQQPVILDAYRNLADDSNGRIRFLTTSRPAAVGGPIPQDAHVIEIPALNEHLARRYLTARDVTDPRHQDQILSLDTDLNWLVLTLAADQATTSDTPLASDLKTAYQNIIDAVVADHDQTAVLPVIDTLAAAGEVAGVGPRLPLPILIDAVNQLHGPDTLPALNTVLNHPRLRRIIERANPATPNETLGLFHLTAIQALTPTDTRYTNTHQAITTALDHTPNP
jgi:hypothetical protein